MKPKRPYAIRRFKNGMWLDLTEISKRVETGALSPRDRATLEQLMGGDALLRHSPKEAPEAEKGGIIHVAV